MSMRLYIIRHGQTEWNSSYRLQGRTDIPLNENGRELAKKTGAALQGISFTCAYTSPLVRARETARLVLSAAGCVPEPPETDTGRDMKKTLPQPKAMASGERHAADSSGQDPASKQAERTGGARKAVRLLDELRLQEISFGEMEGERVRDNNGVLTDENYIRFFGSPETYIPPKGAESFESLLERTGDFLKELKSGELQKKLMVSHDRPQNKLLPVHCEPENILISTHGAASRALLANISGCPLRDFWCGGVPKNCAVTIVDLEDGEWKIKERDKIYYDNENIGL
ncbi:MAG: histidine phosphatase family protein [Lachnospiraceae bacterium]|nr:histidine phosphatase family protein [Lachnospiraceae bacterium]